MNEEKKKKKWSRSLNPGLTAWVIIQSLKPLQRKLTILQTPKVVLFCPQGHSECAVKIPRDSNHEGHFGASV